MNQAARGILCIKGMDRGVQKNPCVPAADKEARDTQWTFPFSSDKFSDCVFKRKHEALCLDDLSVLEK